MKSKTLRLVLLLALTLSIYGCGSKKGPALELIPVKFKKDWAYINLKGDIIIKAQYKSAQNFMDGLALVQNKEGFFGFIDTKGQYVVKPVYKSALGFSEGLACVVPVNGKIQYINKDGSIAFTVDQEAASSFHEGLALVKLSKRYGYINKKGAIAIAPQYAEAKDFKEGLAPVLSTDRLNPAWGYINTKGELVIPYRFEQAMAFNEGFAIVSEHGRYGFIDQTGQYDIQLQGEAVSNMSDGMTLVRQAGQYGFIDKDGNMAIKPRFAGGFAFTPNHLAAVMDTSGKMGYINKHGTYVIHPQYDNCFSFIGNIAFAKTGGKVGIIDEKGQYLAPPAFDGVYIKDLFPELYEAGSSLVKSDNFDMQEFMKHLLGGTDKDHLFGYAANTTLKDLLLRYPNVAANYLGKASMHISLPDSDYYDCLTLVYQYALLAENAGIYQPDNIRKGLSIIQLDKTHQYAVNNADVLDISVTLWLRKGAADKGILIYDELKKQLIARCGFVEYGPNEADRKLNEQDKIKETKLKNDQMACHMYYSEKEGIKCILYLSKGYQSLFHPIKIKGLLPPPEFDASKIPPLTKEDMKR